MLSCASAVAIDMQAETMAAKGHKVKGFSNCSLSGHIVLPRPISREVGSPQVAPFWYCDYARSGSILPPANRIKLVAQVPCTVAFAHSLGAVWKEDVFPRRHTEAHELRLNLQRRFR